MKYQIFKQKFSEMEGLNLRIREAKQGFLFFAFSTLLIALQLDSTSPILRYSG